MYVTCPHVLDLLIDIYEAENTKSSIQEALNVKNIYKVLLKLMLLALLYS